jgi:ubiquinone/menaquinone biosynthesis C-methylase UbiE
MDGTAAERHPMAHIPRPPDWQLPLGVTPGLWEYLHNEELAATYLAKVSDSPFARADEAFVAKHLTFPCKVVDLGCGPGRSLLPLARRGFQCTGIDLSEGMLRQAKRQFAADGYAATWFQANLCEPLPCADSSFDAALCLFGTLGMLHPETARDSFLCEAARVLRVGGTFLLHVHNNTHAYCWKRFLPRPRRRSETVTMPVHQGVANLQMKLFSQREVAHLLLAHGLRVKVIEPISAVQTSSRVNPRRCDGFLVCAVKPGEPGALHTGPKR